MIKNLFFYFFLMTNVVHAEDLSVSYTVQLSDAVPATLKIKSSFPKIRLRPLFSEAEQKILKQFKRSELSQTMLLGPVDGADAIDFEQKFQVLFPEYKLQKNDSLEFYSSPSNAPDPLVNEQWAYKNSGQSIRVDIDDLRTSALKSMVGEDLNLPDSKTLQNLKPVVVAVLDTGLDITHPDLKPNLRGKKEECEALTTYLSCVQDLTSATPSISMAEAEKQCIDKVGNIDRDLNGYPMDCVGWSVTSSLSQEPNSPLSKVLGTPDMDDTLGHGTHVSGIIAAAQNNNIGISGLAPNVKILPVRVIDTPPVSPLRPQSNATPDPSEKNLRLGKSSVELIARGILYAITEKVQVINLSLGWPRTISSDVIADLIRLAQEQGIAVVAAAGNDSTDALVLPCSFSGVICVGSYGPDGIRAAYSNRGPGVDLLAPGTSILSTYPLLLRARFFTDLQGYELMTGTSMATPMVSGALAILLGKGYSLDESLARMLSAARVSGPTFGENLKLDIGRSLKQLPRPWVRVMERAPIRLAWKDLHQTLKGTFTVKNLWKSISKCSLRYSLEPALNTITPTTLLKNLRTSDSIVDCSQWKQDEVKSFSFPIDALGVRASRDFVLRGDVIYFDEKGMQYSQSLAVGVQIIPTPIMITNSLLLKNTAIQGTQAGSGTLVRTLVATDAKSEVAKPEYIVFSRIKEGLSVQILSTRNRSTLYQYSESQKILDLDWAFLVGQRYYSQEAKSTRIALLFRKTSEVTGFTEIRFDVYDESFNKKIRSFIYDGTFAPLPENFQWTTSSDGKDAVLFISNGKEAASGDVWKTTLDLNVAIRCYLLSSEGVLSQIIVDANDPESRIVDFIPKRSEDVEKGENALLIIRGKDYRLQYFIGHLKNGIIASLDPFVITPYRNMGFLSASPFLTSDGPASGSVLSSSVGRGKMRSTVLERVSYDRIINEDYRFSPLLPSEGLSRLVGGYRLNDRRSFFTQTNWDLQFHEFYQGEESVVSTSMNRFSFLPSLVSSRAFFPILVMNEKKSLEPSVLTADIGSGFFNLSALIPERDELGKVIGLLRPAILSFEGNESGCSFIGNPVWDKEENVFRMNSFCGNSIRSVSMALPK